MTRRTLLALPLAAATAQPKEVRLGGHLKNVELDPDWWKPMMLVDVERPVLSLDQLKAAILALNFEDRNELFRWYFGLASTALAFRKKNPHYPLEAHFDIEGWEWDGDI